MTPRRIGLLHPGEMGRIVAATLLNSGHEVYWASEGRGIRTIQRADSLDLHDSVTIPQLAETCEAIVSVCPPEFADALADQVLATKFRGLYLDANAISPERARALDRRLTARGITFVDGGILGPATLASGKVWLYLSGESAAQAASFFTAGPIQPEILSADPGQASALKMCFAAYSKGLTALLASVLATAENHGVREALETRWPITDAAHRIRQAAPKAWRFVPEMHEIAQTFEAAAVDPGFPQSAAAIYQRLASFKNTTPTLDEILSLIRVHPRTSVANNVFSVHNK